MLHKLKRTIAVACLLATACFVILWMRSRAYWDTCSYRDSNGVTWLLDCNAGGIVLREHKWIQAQLGSEVQFESRVRPETEWLATLSLPAAVSDIDYSGVYAPLWLLSATTGIAGVGLFVRRPMRFSLKSFAIAATLIVLTLGLGVAASRLTLG